MYAHADENKLTRTTAGAHFADAEDIDDSYNPKLYLPTGTVIDPEMPALDAVLFQYETQVKRALETIPTTYGPPNVTAAERIELSLINQQLTDGTASIAICKADKD